MRAISVAFAATASLYLLVVFVFEPLRSLAATYNTVVQMAVTGAATLTCTPTVTLPAASGTAGTSGTGSLGAGFCTVTTNNALGYTLFWQVLQGSGSITPPSTGRNCYGTGHLLSNNVSSGKPDLILAYNLTGSHLNKPYRLDTTTVSGALPTGSGSRWGARLRANSATPGGGNVIWGADGATEGFLPVATGSMLSIARKNTESASTGDIENFLYKVVIPSGIFQPTGTYKATVTYTVLDN